MKITTKYLGDIPGTMLYTFYLKYLETKKHDGKIKDQRYEEIINQIDFDFTLFENDIGARSSLFLSCRTLLFDTIVKKYSSAHPDATVVSFGSGLDFRFERVDNGRIQWFDVDLAEVTEIRKAFYKETNRFHLLSASLLDYSWANVIPKKNVLFLSEGLFMYLSPEDVQNIFIFFTKEFPGSLLLVDIFSNFYLQSLKKPLNPYVEKMQSMWKWGIDGWYEVEAWSEDIHFIDEWYPMDMYGENAPSIIADPEIPDFIKEQVRSTSRVSLFGFGAYDDKWLLSA